MQATLSQSLPTRSSLVSLGQNHGYRFEGDTAILNAELAIEPLAQHGDSDLHFSDHREHWALQLWACETPHQGGPLRGIKVAEAALALAPERDRDYLETVAFAQLPPAQRAYAMVLVLASGTAGAYDQVHDFSNYPARQQFAAPHLEGSVGYRFEDDALVLQAEGVRNPRDADNISGSLSLQLWALREPYAGGAFEGVLLGSAELDRLAGQAEERDIERRVSLAQAPEGEWQLALMLREWTEAVGYLTRDFCNFGNRYRVESTYGAEPRAVESYLDWRADELSASNEATADGAVDRDEAREREDEAARVEAREREDEAAHVEARVREEEAARVELRAREDEASAHAELRAREEEAARAQLRAREEAAERAQLRAREEEAERAQLRAREEEAARAQLRAREEEAERAQLRAREEEARAEEAARQAEATERALVAAREASARETNQRSESAAKASKAATPVAKPNGVKKAAADEVLPAETSAPTSPSTGVRVSVQNASLDELASVPGLNKKLAAAIVRARPFASLDDLRHVRGIGDKMLQQLRVSLTL
jgi:DNA uptake protein ComE-like DNA-binding protein